MEKLRYYEIKGGYPLEGEVTVSGAKNAALPAIAATVIVGGEYFLKKVPRVKDVFCMLKIVEYLGGRWSFEKDGLYVDTRELNKEDVPYELASQIRASILFLGALVSRFRRAVVPLPGGCKIGKRPVNFHIDGLKKLGAKIVLSHGNLITTAKRLKPTELVLDFPSVTTTENLLFAASRIEGEVILKNVAQEPEVKFTCEMLKKMGCEIKWLGDNTIVIHGKKNLNSCEIEIIPDRIEAGTFLVLASLSKEFNVGIKNFPINFLETPLLKLKEIGINVDIKGRVLRIKRKRELKPVNIITQPYPGFPTDLQPFFTVLLTQAKGESKIKETLFENRFLYVYELNRMGAGIEVEDSTARILGVKRLVGSPVKATDLRAGAALTIAGLIAENTTKVYNIELIERGYETFIEKLKALGARITLREENFEKIASK